MDLEYILERNLEEVLVKFASYVDCLRDAVKEKCISLEDFHSFLLKLPAFSKSHEGQMLTLLSEKKSKLKETKTFTETFDFLSTECASFLNYGIFQHIVEKYNIKEDKEELKYNDHLKAYIEKHKISEFVKINHLLLTLLQNKIGSTELVLKYDIKTAERLARVTELQKFIARILNLMPSAVEIIDIDKGCVVVTFFIPAPVASAIFTSNTVFTSRERRELQAASVLWLQCNGHTIHFEKMEPKSHTTHIMKPKSYTTYVMEPKFHTTRIAGKMELKSYTTHLAGKMELKSYTTYAMEPKFHTTYIAGKMEPKSRTTHVAGKMEQKVPHGLHYAGNPQFRLPLCLATNTPVTLYPTFLPL